MRRRGFTLIELLVVIAIIGILAAMLFPVFARARESARKTQCLANVKNIAIAMNMYLTDYDRTPPAETRSDVVGPITNWGDNPTMGGADYSDDSCATWANPYLRWPVVLDEYVKNRQIWVCPSAKMQGGATTIISNPNWWEEAQYYAGTWGAAGDYSYKPCDNWWPTGWGGDITDSFIQQSLAMSVGTTSNNAAGQAFVQSIATVYRPGLSTSSMGDASAYVMCADGGAQTKDITLGTTMTPDLCALACGGVCCGADWSDIWDSACQYAHAPNDGSFITDPNKRKPYSRHLGGSNLGFMDGHAKWFAMDAVLAGVKDNSLDGIAIWGPTPQTFLYDGCDYDGATTPSLLK